MKKRDRIYLLYAVFALIYITISLLVPPEAESLRRYNLTPDNARLLRLTILLPYIAIWFAAFYGYVELRKYANKIKKSQDGRWLTLIADGLMILSISLPVQAIISTIFNYVGQRSPGSMDTGTIIANYIDILLTFLAVSTIYKGAFGLSQTVTQKKIGDSYETLYRICFLSLAAIYSYMALANPARQFPTEEASRAAFYLPDFLLFTTIILPYLVIWHLWFRSGQYISAYRKHVKGLLYRNALGYLANGIFLIIMARIALRFLTSLSTLFATASLTRVLVIIYMLLMLIGAGYLVVALGSKKLKRIEEV